MQLAEGFHILFIEDDESDSLLMARELTKSGLQFESQRVVDAQGFRAAVAAKSWDIIISDYSIPGFGGLKALEIANQLDLKTPFVLVSGSVGEEKVAEAIRLGAKDYLLKDRLVRLPAVVEREIKDSREVERRKRAEEKARENLETLERLKRFFPSGVAERIVSGGQTDPFQWHQKEVTVLFVDIHGFTGFVEKSEPELVVQLLNDFYSRIARAALKFQGTIGHVAGDGVMIFFNDPIDIPDPEQMAVRMGVWLREDLRVLQKQWSDKSYVIDFGAGIASGWATVGGLGSEGCWDYSVIGTVANVAHRLCSLAKNGEILIPQSMVAKVSAGVEVSLLGSRELRGLREPTIVYEITGLKDEEGSKN